MGRLEVAISRLTVAPSLPIVHRRRLDRLTPQASLRDAQELVQLRVIKPIAPVDAHKLVCDEGYKLLDVRPVWEWEKAYVGGSLHIPLFVEDDDSGYLTLLKRSIQMGYGGVWMGQRLTTRNPQFLEQVQSSLPEKDQKVLVACGEGLRSLLALDELHEEGYTNLAWLEGGFSRCRGNNFPDVQGSSQLQFANIGGAAGILVKFVLFVQSITNGVTAATAAKDNTR
ncbi:hypothetical protein GOP47_0008401 [Adiantum capillus-veneris]|uniref:Rhodanese domain-containing protein n=1 Tax=Adiantum capillus-veneris TaxID=13818 RepID=A0A9D4UYB9_ADICA|nr:hypothetical protein GOP47_0008401 [Adiantum capillus-veneris]